MFLVLVLLSIPVEEFCAFRICFSYKLFHILDTMDTERTDYMRAAENYAGRSPPNGVYEWTPSLEKQGKTVTYWKIRLSNSKANMAQTP